MADHPTRGSAAVFALKASALRLRRGAHNFLHPIPHLQCADTTDFSHELARSETPLWSEQAGEERWFEKGKVQNLGVAARELDGRVLPVGEVFSFWRQVGPPTARRGFAMGRMLREGCLVPSVGGGLCQLSNALYQAALDAGCEIVERHAHSRTVPGSAAAGGRDATVAWNYVDLRFRAGAEMQLRVKLSADTLLVSLHSISAMVQRTATIAPSLAATPKTADDCDTCARGTCFRKEAVPSQDISRAKLAAEPARRGESRNGVD